MVEIFRVFKECQHWIGLALLIGLPIPLWSETSNPKELTVDLNATVQVDPPAIRLSWTADPNALSYVVSRRLAHQAGWTDSRSLPGNATSYTDSNVTIGTSHEYQVVKMAKSYSGHGYAYAGAFLPLTEDRGKIILIVDETHASSLAFELARLQQDLVGDGWTVIRRNVSPFDSVHRVKGLIKSEYNADPARVKSVFLLGRIPVPYSGDIAPDEHPNHRGAWPADSFYADMNGEWTDYSVTNVSAEKQQNWNSPGDGKFDQSTLPSPLELQVGRVDLSNLTSFSNKSHSRSERDLLREYLNKNHNFRHGKFNTTRRALVCDNFGTRGDPISSSAWRNLAPLLGSQNIVEVGRSNYFQAVRNDSYLWSFGAGGGGFTSCEGIGSSDDWALNTVNSVFTMFLGSFFGDWDNESNFLRSVLGASGQTLTVAYSGFPHWFFHHMALGETIGFSTLVSQNNRPRGLYPPNNQGSHQVHIALMGDPTLRMHPVIPPAELTGGWIPQGFSLRWQASTDANLAGYHVYRASTSYGPFIRISDDSPVIDTQFLDRSFAWPSVYMVRAIKLETSPSGSYYNASQGIFTSTGRTGPPIQPYHPLQISNAAWSNGRFQMQITGTVGRRFSVEMSVDMANWASLGTYSFTTSVYEFTDGGNAAEAHRFYRVRLVD